MATLTGCATERPNVHLVLAREAFTAAKEVESARYAPGYYHKAEESYRRGMNAYQEGKMGEAVKEFKNSKVYAEKAENAARIQRQKQGDEAL